MFATSLGEDGAQLCPLEPWQAEEYLAHLDRGRDFIGRYIPLPDVCADLEAARAFLQGYADRTAADTGRLYGIRLDGTLVGGVMFRTMDHATGVCEVGCWLEPSAVGRGLVTRAATAIIDWAVEARGMYRVEWVVSPANTASVNVAKRLGMTRDGALRGAYVLRGERGDKEVWSVLAPEWRGQRA
ncbi:GNAT family N-acetyltransferase [Streptomyces sp. MUM 203J]|uniref:GNAT family N-acetyltransferase n=1 Tax=Streptomyces sp. MUM 203J TaxID=2791990 RepID=UPI001F0481C0|nr:GNAT family protein [Streptomyces sp. MUM 203J]MCH0537994.1 GNAT family N-acetyltransferase [Streptomyces sp. MUM 203J]